MAKSYAQRNQESINRYGKTLYQRRIDVATSKGLSRSQARGHARVARGEQPASVVSQAKRQGPPKITKRYKELPSGNRVYNTRSTSKIYNTLKTQRAGKRVSTPQGGRGQRVYFQVLNPSTGEYVNVYYGSKNRKGPHGITVQELLARIDERKKLGMTTDEAIRDTLVEDSSESSGVDSPEGEEVAYDFTDILMYIN